MAVAFDSVGPSGGGGASSTSSTTLSWTHTVAAGGDGTVLLAWVAPDSGLSSVVVSATLDGVSMTKLGSANPSGTTGCTATLFGATGVSTGAHTIASSMTGGTPLDMTAGRWPTPARPGSAPPS